MTEKEIWGCIIFLIISGMLGMTSMINAGLNVP